MFYKYKLIDILKYAVFLILIVLTVIFLSQRIGYNWQFYRIKEFLYNYENGR
ncbi:MAG TPA: polar amino acid ABC transporter permease, partial [Flexistipes sinusarabici]|nr:polar amino acid ABC transporter permease [Flexistipes sinusarabici]